MIIIIIIPKNYAYKIISINITNLFLKNNQIFKKLEITPQIIIVRYTYLYDY